MATDSLTGGRRRRAGGLAAATAALVLGLVGCSGSVDLDTEEREPSPSTTTEDPARPVAQVSAPDSPYSLIAGETANELAIGASRAYVEQAQLAVVAPADDRAAVLQASSIGAAVGAPVLVSGAQDGALDTELLRLGVVGVVTVGAVDLNEVDTTSLVIAPAPATAAELGDLLGMSLDGVPLPTEEDADDVAALLDLPAGTVFEQAAAVAGGPDAVGELPELTAPESLEGAVVLTDGSPNQIPAIATARAAGATAVVASGDVRGDEGAVEALGELAPSTVVGLGTGYGSLETFTWRTETAATGTQLPGGGQLVFDDKRYVALYGSPVTPSLGVLGEQGPEETVERAARIAAHYAALTSDTVVPALEIIVTVATGGPGEDGNYSQEWSSDTFVPLIEEAAAAGQYVVLDFQPGRTSFLDQVRQYEDLLMYPNVGIALDPEWRLGADEVHLQQIGSVTAAEVDATTAYLADFVREHRLPQKMVILHQFQLAMISDRQDLETGRSEVALLIHADGQGSQGAKQATWRALHEDAPEGVAWGWKNFLDEDSPVLTPSQTYDVEPAPDFVSYQ